MPPDEAANFISLLRDAENPLSILSSIDSGPTHGSGLGLPRQHHDAAEDQSPSMDNMDSMTAASPPRSSFATSDESSQYLDSAGDGSSSSPRSISTVRSEAATTTPSLSGPSQYCDARLDHIEINQWTSVPVTNAAAARVISLYLITDHRILGFFDADMFLDALVSGEQRFCSPLLVNALLSWACQAYTSMQQESAILHRRFTEEAERLWQQDGSTDTINTAVAAQYLSFGRSCNGNDDLGEMYTREGHQMAERLGLFDRRREQGRLDDGQIRSASCAGWGIYNWLVLRSLVYHQDFVFQPPCLPIPNAEGPHADRPFPALCNLWLLANEFILLYYAPSTISISQRIPLTSAEWSYRKLLAWREDFAGVLDPTPRSHDADILHILYHCVVIEIFRPFVSQNLTLAMPSQSGAATPEAAIGDSFVELKAQVQSFPLKHDAAHYTIWWHYALLYVANVIVYSPIEPSGKYWFLLCAKAYQDLTPCFRMAAAILRALLTMATEKGLLSRKEAEECMADAREKSIHHEVPDTDLTLALQVDQWLSLTDKHAARADVLGPKIRTADV